MPFHSRSLCVGCGPPKWFDRDSVDDRRYCYRALVYVRFCFCSCQKEQLIPSNGALPLYITDITVAHLAPSMPTEPLRNRGSCFILARTYEYQIIFIVPELEREPGTNGCKPHIFSIGLAGLVYNRLLQMSVIHCPHPSSDFLGHRHFLLHRKSV